METEIIEAEMMELGEGREENAVPAMVSTAKGLHKDDAADHNGSAHLVQLLLAQTVEATCFGDHIKSQLVIARFVSTASVFFGD